MPEITVSKKPVRVALPATCGELFQGTLDRVRCLVSCPIDRYSVAEVSVWLEPGWQFPPDTPKAIAALRAGLAYLQRLGLGGCLQLTSDLPRGRGYGSSTADVGATLYALGQAVSQPLTASEVAQLAVGVEPSDSTPFSGLALFDHRGGSFYEDLGPAPPLSVIVLDPGGEVDTLAFNQCNHRTALKRLASQHQRAFTLLQEGLERGDWEAIGEAATLSARAHQAILPDPLLERALALAQDLGALGVCRAHSGTLLGLLVDPVEVDVPAAVDFLVRHLPDTVTVAGQRVVDGGSRYVSGKDRLALKYQAGTESLLKAG